MKKALPRETVAIIGVSCRFPGQVSDLNSYWNLLEKGVDAVTHLPPDRFSSERYLSSSRTLAGHTYTQAAGVLDGIKDFDPDFFGISRKEVSHVDPQQRLALELAWEACEQAHILPSSLRGSKTGVFIGASNVDMTLQSPNDPAVISPYSMTGSTLSIIANRISYLFDLHGPSLTIDTACSSSLVALHLACEALRSGEIPLALVGGVNILLSPYPFIGFSRAQMLSPDGRCKAFDAAGNGYVRSEGAGVVLLKPLRQAQKDGDAILAVIAASGVNSDGRTAGISLPNGKAQAQLLRDVYADFHLDKNKLVYMEAHGTGTAVGDPIEASAIGTVLGKPLRGVRTLPMGSAKSNIGHLEPAAGMAGLIKGLLVLQKGAIPPNIHFTTPNPAIDFNGLNLAVPVKLTQIPSLGGDELVSVNSFGFGGTNAHVVLQSPPQRPSTKKRRSTAPIAAETPPLFLSARSRNSLSMLAGSYAAQLAAADAQTVYDTAATMALHRDPLKFRAVLTAETPLALLGLLKQLEKEQGDKEKTQFVMESLGEKSGGVFAFSGNGSQWCGMGTALLCANKDVVDAVEEVDSLLSRYQDWSLMDVLRQPEQHENAYDYTSQSQPLLFAVQVGLVRALQAKGIVPAAVLGHSVGEVAAAWACGALSLPDAVKVIHFRSHFQELLRDKGHMAVANVPEEKAQELLLPFAGRIEIAAVNSERSITLAGESKALHKFIQQCKQHSISAKMLDLPYPFHTTLMDGIQEALINSLQDIQPKKPRIPFFSTALPSGKKRLLDNEYWWHNIRQPVRFLAGMQTALNEGHRLFLEVGPHPILSAYMRSAIGQSGVQAHVIPTLSRTGDEPADFAAAWKTAWQYGWKLNAAQHFSVPYTQKALPAYPWSREYFWADDTPECRKFLTNPRAHPLLGWPLPGNTPVFENTLSLADFPWLADHVAGSSTPYPAAAFIESLLAAAREVYPGERQQLERVTLLRPLLFTANTAHAVRLSVDKEDGGAIMEGRAYMGVEPFGLYAKARIVPAAEIPDAPDLAFGVAERFGVAVEKTTLYEVAKRFLLRYGPAFQTVEQAWVRTDAARHEILARLCDPDVPSAQGMIIPPTLLDGAFQTLFILLGAHKQHTQVAYLPAAFERITLYAEGVPSFAHAKLERFSPRSVVASFRLLDASGKVLLHLEGCRFRRAAWLEHEKTAPSPYAMELETAPHPKTLTPLVGINVSALGKLVEQFLKSGVSVKTDAEQVHPSMLLQLTALAAAHETVLSLCDVSPELPNISVQELLDSGQLAPAQEPWFQYLLELLESAQLAERVNDIWQIQPLGERLSARILWRTLLSNSPGFLREASLLSHIFSQSKAILAGTYEQAEETILLNKLTEAYFSSSAVLQPFTEALRECLKKVMRVRQSGQVLQVLQLAKDSRGVLSILQPLLAKKPYKTRYVAAAPDAAAAETLALSLGNPPDISFCALDTQAPALEHLGRYHCIIVAYSLHEQVNSALTLSNLRTMLAPGGVLCLLEHAPNWFANFVFGAEPRWWSASPSREQPVSLLQTQDFWQRQLQAAGFADVVSVAHADAKLAPAFLLLAQSPLVESEGLALPIPSAPAPRAEEGDRDSPSESEVRPCWLVLTGAKTAPSAALAENLYQALAVQTKNVRLLFQDDALETGSFVPEDPACWATIFAGYALDEPLELIFLNGYDTRDELTVRELARVQTNGTVALAALSQACGTSNVKPRLWVVTGGALSAENAPGRPVPSQGALAGFTRVLQQEMRSLDIRLLDLHGEKPDTTATVQEVLFPTVDREVVLSGGLRYVSRLAHLMQRPAPSERQAQEPVPVGATLSFDAPGKLQNLYWAKTPVPTPGPDEVCVAVHTTGLNFRDVMWSMGLLLDEALENGFSGPAMGLECAGLVVAVGEDVTEWEAGDEVLCFAPACFSTHVLTKANAVAKKPSNLSFEEAATIPVAFMTAWYSLKHLAGMRPGERVLIHGAAGGVGLAAIQIAAQLGLEVYATAGSAEKHHFLRQLGVKHLFSSRSLHFAPQIRELTQGKGVDAVLNSLSGEAIAAGISVLRPFGRFIELGKRDFYADTPMRLRPFSNNLSYFGVDVDQLLTYQPVLVRTLFGELMDLFAQKKLIPLPYTTFPVVKTVEAFHTMQQSAHIGKLVVKMDGAERIAQAAGMPRRKLKLQKDATYLITGGTSGFGLATAARLAKRGATNLLLLSRSGEKDDEARQAIAAMRNASINIVLVKADVGDSRSLRSALKKHLVGLPPLRGVVHAAAVLDDGIISGLNPERISNSLAAKTLGAWNLHTETLACPLDFFVLYSSATTAFGNPGQAGYVAANTMLETLAAWRKSRKLPAQVIGWGPIGDTGMLKRNAKAQKLLTNMLGVSPVSSEDALYWLEHCISTERTASHYFGLDWHNRADLPALANARFSRLRPRQSASQATQSAPLERIRAASPAEGKKLLAVIVLEEIAAVLRMSAEALSTDTTLISLGMDSLMAVELGLALEQKFELTGYTPALSEKTTAATLADQLHALLMGGGDARDGFETDASSAQEQRLVEAIASKQGVHLSNAARHSALESLKGKPV